MLAALDALQPDCVLVEGPPDADAQIPMVGDPELRAPVALLVYPPDEPERAAVYPFAEWSPELQALRWAVRHGSAVAFMDLPVSRRIPLDRRADDAQAREPDEPGLHWLAEAGGFADGDAFWEELVELRRDPTDVFEAVHEAVSALRPDLPATEVPSDARALREARREAWMRRTLRAAEKTYDKVAVVCGAWHAPALTQRPTASYDTAVLKGLSRVKTNATWVPWTHSRLTFASGYGAGLRAPGWYAHIWQTPADALSVGWVSKAARELRDAGHDVSSAHVIEAVRLADSLAALRERSGPGLRELSDAMVSVFTRGEQGALAVVRESLEVADTLGEVPDDAPTVPLVADVHAKQRRLRLKASPEPREVKLDLRKPRDREKSQLLHQLALLRIPWGEPEESSGDGTFWEAWKLEWDPGFAVRLVMANLWGSSSETAAAAFALHQASETDVLAKVVGWLRAALLAGLEPAIEPIVERLRGLAALDAELAHLMEALVPLAETRRYGDVRGTSIEAVQPILQGLFDRIVVGLPTAARGLSHDAAAQLLTRTQGVSDTVGLLRNPAWMADWLLVLERVCADEVAHPLLRGRAARWLLERGRLDDHGLAASASLALSPAVEPLLAAAWLEGVLSGSGLLLLHQDGLWRALDDWLVALPDDVFEETLPAVRRAFSAFEPSVRRRMGARVHSLSGTGGLPTTERAETQLNVQRAESVRLVLRSICGVTDV
ncbi:MAG: hypothetical protein KC912_24975 [Proteobacteria bacterium]|nr:hypothetical protein [Pseudomonadota bacterium]